MARVAAGSRLAGLTSVVREFFPPTVPGNGRSRDESVVDITVFPFIFFDRERRSPPPGRRRREDVPPEDAPPRRPPETAEPGIILPPITPQPFPRDFPSRPPPRIFGPFGVSIGVFISQVIGNILREKEEKRRREAEQNRDTLEGPAPGTRPPIPGVDTPDEPSRPRPVREPGADRPDRPTRPAPPIAIPGPDLPPQTTDRGGAAGGTVTRGVLEDIVFSEVGPPPRIPRAQTPPPDVRFPDDATVPRPSTADILLPPLVEIATRAPPARVPAPSVPRPATPSPALPQLGLVLGTGLLPSLSRLLDQAGTPARARDLLRETDLTQIDDAMPLSAQPSRATSPPSARAGTRQCECVKRRRRRKGKCREGFFVERPRRTEFTTWRERDCVTGTVTRKS